MASLIFAKKLLITAFFSFCFFISQATHTDGHKIKGTISNYQGSHAFLAMLYGGNQYMVDTAQIYNGTFTFESRYDLQSGVYLVILPPASSFLLLVDQNEREIAFTADANDIENTIVFNGSKDNTAYYEYLSFFRGKKANLDKIKAEYDAQKNEPDKVALLANMQQLKKDVVTHQTEIVTQN